MYQIRLLAALGALLLAPGASSVQAQAPRKSEIRGVILRAEDGNPIAGVRVTLEGTDLAVETDPKGRFKFPKVAAGKYVVWAVVDSYPPSVVPIDIAQGERVDLEFQVGVKPAPELPAVSLPEVSVSAPAPVSPVPEFNRHATSGAGRYLTREYIEKHPTSNLMDLLKTVPGIRIRCPRRDGVCTLSMTRSPPDCSVKYFQDGLPTHSSALYMTSPRDIEGIEIYSGPSETPPEYEGYRSLCGVIVIWTRVGRRPPG
jgi:hypothetical protein